MEKHHITKSGNRRLKLDGKKFGRLTVLKLNDIDSKRKESRWLCKCECGTEVIVRGYRLTNGHTQSCGCLSKENSITHGLSNNPLYAVWKAMLRRCENEDDANFHHYGGRGIKVCKEWENIETFYGWSINNGYEKGLEIDRINNNGNYEPNNCRYTTRKQQLRNKRNNIITTIGEKTKTLADWADEYNLKINTIQYRYHRGDRGERLVRPTETKYIAIKEGGSDV